MPEYHGNYTEGAFGSSDFGDKYGNIVDGNFSYDRIIFGYGIDACKSSNVFNRSDTVQPSSIKALTVVRT